MKPNLLIVYGDRLESLAACFVAINLNLPICHFQGGDLSGNIDENIRHSITKLSNLHFTSNYLSQIGWKTDQPCFLRVNLSTNIPKEYLNVSAKKLHNKKKLKYFSKFINNINDIDTKYKNLEVAIVTPDKDIIPDAETLNPAYIVFDNYEIILQWNRSLRFALAVCTLKNKFKDELK